MSEKYKIDPEIYLETACTLITIHGLIKQELGLGSAVTIADGMATAIKCKESLLVGNIGLEEMAQKELDPNIQKQYRYMEKQRQWMHASKWYCTPQCHQFDRRAAACLGRVYWARTELGWKYYIHVDKDKTAFNKKHTKKTAYDIEKVLGAKIEDGTLKIEVQVVVEQVKA